VSKIINFSFAIMLYSAYKNRAAQKVFCDKK
jgi:hypothetical protein